MFLKSLEFLEKLVTLAALTLALLPNPVHAQSSGPPTFSIGDEWTRSDGEVRRVVKITPDNVIVSGRLHCPTCLTYYDKNLALIKVTQKNGAPVDASVGVGRIPFVPTGTEWKTFEFPLQPGKKWTSGAKGVVRNNVIIFSLVNTVEAYEDVTTKAGTFKAFRIRRDVSTSQPFNSQARGGPSWTTTEWYSPSAKAVVKWTSTNRNLPGWELTALTVK